MVEGGATIDPNLLGNLIQREWFIEFPIPQVSHMGGPFPGTCRGFYDPGDYELVGFIVGLVDRSRFWMARESSHGTC